MRHQTIRRKFIFPLFSLGALMATSACCLIPGYAPGASTTELTETSMPVVTGTATYRERMMAPAGSVLKVVLQDTSRADAAAVTVAEWSASLDEGGVPKAFTLTPAAPLDPRMTYTVRATVNGPDAALLWTTDTAHRVPSGVASSIDLGELVMVKVTPYVPPASPLGGGEWIIETIGGTEVPGPNPPTITFADDGKVNGYGGCNRFGGSYEQKGATVSFSPIMMTMMACAAGNRNQMESALGAALKGEATYVVNGDGVLTLTGANGTVITAKKAAVFPLLAKSYWEVTSMGGTAIVSGREPMISFVEGGRIEGTTGCNSFFGGYTQEGAALSFSQVGSTKMACPYQGVMAQESAFLAILSGSAEASIDGAGKLTIKGANGVSFTGTQALLAERATPGDPALLTGSEWVVEDINRGGVIDNTRLTLNFGADGKVSGSDNCNRFNGTYTVDGSKLTLSPLASTRRACIGEALAGQARKYTAALAGELSWSLAEDGALVLTGAEGARVLLRR